MANKPSSPNLSRKEFAKVVMTFLGSIMGVVTGLPIIGFIISPASKTEQVDDWISLGNLDKYEIGIPNLFSFTRTKVNGWERTTNSYGVFVIRDSETKVRVLSNVCTHLSCRVNWVEDTQTFNCPCHDAEFDINGEVLSGPPPKPLVQWSGDDIQIDQDGNLLIHFMEG